MLCHPTIHICLADVTVAYTIGSINNQFCNIENCHIIFPALSQCPSALCDLSACVAAMFVPIYFAGLRLIRASIAHECTAHATNSYEIDHINKSRMILNIALREIFFQYFLHDLHTAHRMQLRVILLFLPRLPCSQQQEWTRSRGALSTRPTTTIQFAISRAAHTAVDLCQFWRVRPTFLIRFVRLFIGSFDLFRRRYQIIFALCAISAVAWLAIVGLYRGRLKYYRPRGDITRMRMSVIIIIKIELGINLFSGLIKCFIIFLLFSNVAIILLSVVIIQYIAASM